MFTAAPVSRGGQPQAVSMRSIFPLHSIHLIRPILLGLFLLAASPGSAFAVSVTDALDRHVEIGNAQRIVSLGSDVTEIAFALGGADRIIGVDRGSNYPAEADAKPDVGYRRSISVEGLMALNPDLILATEDIGPPEALEVLKTLSIPIVFVPVDNSGHGIERKIELIGEVFGAEEQGVALAKTVMAKFDATAALAAAVPSDQRKKVVFFHGLLRLTGAGAGTSAGAIINLAGAENPLDIYSGYKAVSEESLLQLQPDVVVMMSNGAGGPTPEEVFAIPALANTPAGRNKALIVLDGAYMIGFGPRTADAISSLTTALYPHP